MTTSRTKRTAPPSSSSADVRLTVPASWKELTQEQLRYVLTLMAEGLEGTELKTYMFIRFAGITVHRRSKDGWKCSQGKQVFYMARWQVQFCIDKMKFVDSYEGMDVRLDGIQGYHAVNALLKGVPFKDYLKMEAAYFGYQRSKAEKPLLSLARLLYRDDKGKPAEGMRPDKAELLGCLLWFAHAKTVLAEWFPNFFRKLPMGTEQAEDYDMRAAMDAQIRALTDGDVTKNETVYGIDCWEALAELDAKAREAKEAKKIRSKN